MERFFVVSRRVLLISIASLTLHSTGGMSNAAEERIFGTILDEEGEFFLVEAEDGTRYKVEWYGGSSLCSVGGSAILTAVSVFGYVATARIALTLG